MMVIPKRGALVRATRTSPFLRGLIVPGQLYVVLVESFGRLTVSPLSQPSRYYPRIPATMFEDPGHVRLRGSNLKWREVHA